MTPIQHRPHGTRAKYNVEKCRCARCRAANSDYEKQRVRRNAYGRSNLVDAAQARQHVRGLLHSGMGRRRVAAVAGVPESVVNSLLYGKRGRQLGRVHHDTARKVLAVDSADPADGALVDAATTWRMLDELIALGVPKARIARALGKQTPALRISRNEVRLSTRRSVARMHWSVWMRSGELRAACRCAVPREVLQRLEELEWTAA